MKLAKTHASALLPDTSPIADCEVDQLENDGINSLCNQTNVITDVITEVKNKEDVSDELQLMNLKDDSKPDFYDDNDYWVETFESLLLKGSNQDDLSSEAHAAINELKEMLIDQRGEEYFDLIMSLVQKPSTGTKPPCNELVTSHNELVELSLENSSSMNTPQNEIPSLPHELGQKSLNQQNGTHATDSFWGLNEIECPETIDMSTPNGPVTNQLSQNFYQQQVCSKKRQLTDKVRKRLKYFADKFGNRLDEMEWFMKNAYTDKGYTTERVLSILSSIAPNFTRPNGMPVV